MYLILAHPYDINAQLKAQLADGGAEEEMTGFKEEYVHVEKEHAQKTEEKAKEDGGLSQSVGVCP